MNSQVIWQPQGINLIKNNSQHYDSQPNHQKQIGICREEIPDNGNNCNLGLSYNSNSNSNSNSKDRCKTDPDSESEIKKQRKVVKNFIQESQQKQRDNQKLLRQDLDLQSERIHNRIRNRRYSKPMLKSSSCEVYFSKEYKSECTSVADTTSIVDTEDFEYQLEEDIILELDVQRDEKIYRIVRHYNNQIDNLRALKMDEDTLKLMVDLERKKWEEIEIIQEQYDQIKLEQSTIRKQ